MFAKYNNSYYEYYCNYLFPQAIEYGMSAEEFWKDDPQLYVSYRTSFINKQKRELEANDYKSWLLGLYIHDGNSRLFVMLKQYINNIFSKTKDNKKIESYPKKPYMELEKDKKKEEIENKKKLNYKEFENSLIYYGTLKQQYIEKIKKKGEKI